MHTCFICSDTENVSNAFLHDMNIVLVTQLREQVESLKKSLSSKEKELFDKERKVRDRCQELCPY